jgi:hypothetical protein
MLIHALVGDTVRLKGVFDNRAARKLDQFLAEAPPDRRVIIDFAGLREIDPHALWRFACGERRPKMTVHGLRDRDRVLLKYLGIDAGTFEPASS